VTKVWDASTLDEYLGGKVLSMGRFNRGHFEGERVGMPFPLLKSCRNAWEWHSHCQMFKNAQNSSQVEKK